MSWPSAGTTEVLLRSIFTRSAALTYMRGMLARVHCGPEVSLMMANISCRLRFTRSKRTALPSRMALSAAASLSETVSGWGISFDSPNVALL